MDVFALQAIGVLGVAATWLISVILLSETCDDKIGTGHARCNLCAVLLPTVVVGIGAWFGFA